MTPLSVTTFNSVILRLCLCIISLLSYNCFAHGRDKPPTKGVVAVNMNFARVKRPISFKLIWPLLASKEISNQGITSSVTLPNGQSSGDDSCSIWFPEAPRGYVALGCVVSAGRKPPPLSSVFCILASLVSPCPLRDCIAIFSPNLYAEIF